MPEHTVTESRGRNKYGHRSVTERKNRFRCPSPPQNNFKAGNISSSNQVSHCHQGCSTRLKLGMRIDNKTATKKYLDDCKAKNYSDS